MATYNSTSWARALRYLRSAPETVRVVMLQEHHLMSTDALRRAQAAAGASGWKVLYEPATPSAGSDRSPSFNTGGVAIAVRAELTIVRQDYSLVLPGAPDRTMRPRRCHNRGIEAPWQAVAGNDTRRHLEVRTNHVPPPPLVSGLANQGQQLPVVLRILLPRVQVS